jgi:hypothetical protein
MHPNSSLLKLNSPSDSGPGYRTGSSPHLRMKAKLDLHPCSHVALAAWMGPAYRHRNAIEGNELEHVLQSKLQLPRVVAGTGNLSAGGATDIGIAGSGEIRGVGNIESLEAELQYWCRCSSP